MVPGSTFRYGSNFIRLTFSPRLSSRHPSDAAANPLPNDETTPPVMKMYLAAIARCLRGVFMDGVSQWRERSRSSQWRGGRSAAFLRPHKKAKSHLLTALR